MYKKINFLYVLLPLMMLCGSIHTKDAPLPKKQAPQAIIIEDPECGTIAPAIKALKTMVSQYVLACSTWFVGAQAPRLNHMAARVYKQATYNPPTEAEEIAYLHEHPMPSDLHEKFEAILTPKRQQLFAEGKWEELEKDGFTFYSKGEPDIPALEKYVPESAAGIVAFHRDAPDWVIKAENPNKKTAPFCPKNKKIKYIKDANGNLVRFHKNIFNGQIEESPQGQMLLYKFMRPNNFLRIHHRNDIQDLAHRFDLQIKVPEKHPFFAKDNIMVIAEKVDPNTSKPMTRRQYNDMRFMIKKIGYHDIQKNAQGPVNVIPKGDHVLILDTERHNQHMPTAWLAYNGECNLQNAYPEHRPYQFYEKDYYRYWEKKDFATAGLIAASGALVMQYVYNNIKLTTLANTFKQKLTASYEKRPHISLEEYARVIVHGKVHADIENAVIKTLVEWHETEKSYPPSQAYKINTQYIGQVKDLLAQHNPSMIGRIGNGIGNCYGATKNYITSWFVKEEIKRKADPVVAPAA